MTGLWLGAGSARVALCGVRRLAVRAAARDASGLSAQRRPMVIDSEPLRGIVGGHDLLPRNEIIKKVSEYVRENGLKDPDNGKEFKCDSKLQAVFNVPSMPFLRVSSAISPMLRKPVDMGPEYIRRAEKMEEEIIKSAGTTQRKESVKAAKATARKNDVVKTARAEGKGLFAPLKVSPTLQAIVGEAEMARPDIVKNIWQYIKAHKLQDKADGRRFKLDAKLKALMPGATEGHAFTLGKFIKDHVTKM